MTRELNKEQLTALSNLSFDLAKGSLLLSFFPFRGATMDIISTIMLSLTALLAGVAFTLVGLVILRLKTRSRL
jgi:hypothetical protein